MFLAHMHTKSTLYSFAIFYKVHTEDRCEDWSRPTFIKSAICKSLFAQI